MPNEFNNDEGSNVNEEVLDSQCVLYTYFYSLSNDVSTYRPVRFITNFEYQYIERFIGAIVGIIKFRL